MLLRVFLLLFCAIVGGLDWRRHKCKVQIDNGLRVCFAQRPHQLKLAERGRLVVVLAHSFNTLSGLGLFALILLGSSTF